jgi:hypothetical protein
MRIRIAVVGVIVSSLLFGATLSAQQRHVIDPAGMRQALATQAVTDQQNRNVLLNVLRHKQVRDMANRLGLDVTRAESAVSTLGSAELAELASTARTTDADLAGGNKTIVISTTTLLLIIIIVILLAN